VRDETRLEALSYLSSLTADAVTGKYVRVRVYLELGLLLVSKLFTCGQLILLVVDITQGRQLSHCNLSTPRSDDQTAKSSKQPQRMPRS